MDPFGHSRPELVVCSLGRTKLQQLDVDVATGNYVLTTPSLDATGDDGDLVTGSSANKTWVLWPHLATVRILPPDLVCVFTVIT